MSNNYYQRAREGKIQRGEICSCDKDRWCSNCPPERFPKPSGNSMIFTGNTVDYNLAKKLSELYEE